ncbi:signal transduction histidine kinase [Hamadaea flava]|nr:signal transduction histidine kinase [Hamadaea flava]
MEQQWTSLGLSPLSRVRLDELLQELLDRVGDVMNSRERLRSLLDAVVGMGTDLDLHATLERIVVSACHLADAKYGALGVIGGDRQLIEFITHGMDPKTHKAIGNPPTGKGVLGLLIGDPRPVRLPDITRHPQSAGFPPGHPPMHSFLGVPIRVRDHIFGNLYLSEKQGAPEFSDDDEEIMVALAAAAGAAIENARLYALAGRRQRWLQATAEVAATIADVHDAQDPLAIVVRKAREAADAVFTTVVLLDDDGDGLTVAACDSIEPLDGLVGETIPLEGSAIEAAITRGEQLEVEHVGKAATWPVTVPELRASISPFGHSRGALIVAYAGEPRETEELRLVGLFASQAALALDRAQAHLDREQLLLLSDRERIARDLHDVVIQRLFATGLQLQTVAALATKPEVANRIHQSVDDLDATIRDIRGAIFELRAPTATSLRAEIRGLAERASAGLGFRPALRLDGPVDSAVPVELHGDILAVVNEALSNVIRHAQATELEMAVAVQSGRLTVTVYDNGRGGAKESSGLANARERARQHGGDLDLTSPPDEGTRVVWSVPLA